MVNEPLTHNPERELAVSYAAAEARPALRALLALDETLGGILRTTREPMVGQMRLTWWYEALERLDTAPPPAQPVLEALAASVLPAGVAGATLAAMVDGWEVLLVDDAPDEEALSTYARERGGRLFGAAARVLGVADERVGRAGEGWALADLAGNDSRPEVAARARSMATERLEAALAGGWPTQARALGALALSARAGMTGTSGAARVGRLLLHRLTGL